MLERRLQATRAEHLGEQLGSARLAVGGRASLDLSQAQQIFASRGGNRHAQEDAASVGSKRHGRPRPCTRRYGGTTLAARPSARRDRQRRSPLVGSAAGSPSGLVISSTQASTSSSSSTGLGTSNTSRSRRLLNSDPSPSVAIVLGEAPETGRSARSSIHVAKPSKVELTS